MQEAWTLSPPIIILRSQWYVQENYLPENYLPKE